MGFRALVWTEDATMGDLSDDELKLTPNQRRAQTDRAFAAIMEDERRARLEKNARLREMRLLRSSDES